MIDRVTDAAGSLISAAMPGDGNSPSTPMISVQTVLLVSSTPNLLLMILAVLTDG